MLELDCAALARRWAPSFGWAPKQPVTGHRGLFYARPDRILPAFLATVALLLEGHKMERQIGQYLLAKASVNYSQHTLTAYRSDLSTFAAWLAKRSPPILEPSDITGDAAMDWLVGMRASGLRSSTVARRYAAVRGFLGWLALRGEIKHTLSLPLSIRRDPPSLPRVPAIEAIQAMISACDPLSPIGSRNRAIIEFMYSTGCRAAETVNLKLDTLRLERGTAIVLGKGNKERMVGLGTSARRAIKDYLEWHRRPSRDRRDAQHVFLTWDGHKMTTRALGRIIATCSRHAHIPDVHPHTLRHAFATHMIEAGAGLLEVKELLGHSSVRSTQVYTHITPNSVLAAHRKYHPRAGDHAPREAETSGDGDAATGPDPNPAH